MYGNRRTLLKAIACMSAAPIMSPSWSNAWASEPSQMRSRLHLLGTGGGPSFGGERRMACNAITIGGRAYVVDCGYGAVEALIKGDIALREVSNIFITHDHADHIMDYGSLLFAAWLQGRADAIGAYGPSPLAEITGHLLAANETALENYRVDMGMRGMPAVNVHELSSDELLLDDGVVKVRCAQVVHPPVSPAFGYRFELPDRSIVFSGDTAPTQSLIKLAKGADILVHEATIVDAMLQEARARRAQNEKGEDGATQPTGYDYELFKEHVLKAHTSAEDAGRVASKARVKTLVLNHLAPISSRIVADGEWIAHARRHFSGEIIVAHDGVVL